MRFISLLPVVFLSIPLLAMNSLLSIFVPTSFTFKLVSDVIEMEATFSPDSLIKPVKGTVVAKSKKYGSCNGVYSVSTRNSELTIDFDSTDGAVGCQNESMTVFVNEGIYMKIKAGEQTPVFFTLDLYSEMVHEGIIRPVK